jgi:Fe-Mn family superoxide dismutase
MNDVARKTEKQGPFSLPVLPWGENALEPVISARTIELHHGKHHKTYVEKLNKLVAGTEFERLSLHEVVKRTHDDPAKTEIFNNAGQALNHAIYWESLTPKATQPSEEVRRMLTRDFGGYETFLDEFAELAISHFGSGWAWLVVQDRTLRILSTSNAETPVAMGATPLLTVDVWEHAYYLDYQNKRDEHVKAVVKRLLNWEYAASSLARA